MQYLKCGEETVFEICGSCQVNGNVAISIKEYNQLLDYKIKATVCYDKLMAEKKKLEKQKKQRNCQIADLKARLKEAKEYKQYQREYERVLLFITEKGLYQELKDFTA